jgi:tRNA (guanine26-N2/guanine27-N2)-dimethyltransferase
MKPPRHHHAPICADINVVCCPAQVQKGNGIKYTPGAGPAVPQQCPETGAGFLMGGPFWAEPIHDMDWVAGLLQLVKEQKDK